MTITSDVVYEGLLLSSIFLMAISLPKITIITAWSTYRTWIYEHVRNPKILKKIFSEEFVNNLDVPEKKYAMLANEMSFISSGLKMPAIEMISALFFMGLSSYQLDVDSSASFIILILMLAMIVVGILAFIQLIRLMLKTMKLKGGVIA